MLPLPATCAFVENARPEPPGTLKDAEYLPVCPKRHSSLEERTLYFVPGKTANKGRGISMRVFIASAIILTAAIGLGGCWGHHEKAVVQEPLKLG